MTRKLSALSVLTAGRKIPIGAMLQQREQRKHHGKQRTHPAHFSLEHGADPHTWPGAPRRLQSRGPLNAARLPNFISFTAPMAAPRPHASARGDATRLREAGLLHAAYPPKANRLRTRAAKAAPHPLQGPPAAPSRPGIYKSSATQDAKAGVHMQEKRRAARGKGILLLAAARPGAARWAGPMSSTPRMTRANNEPPPPANSAPSAPGTKRGRRARSRGRASLVGPRTDDALSPPAIRPQPGAAGRAAPPRRAGGPRHKQGAGASTRAAGAPLASGPGPPGGCMRSGAPPPRGCRWGPALVCCRAKSRRAGQPGRAAAA